MEVRSSWRMLCLCVKDALHTRVGPLDQGRWDMLECLESGWRLGLGAQRVGQAQPSQESHFVHRTKIHMCDFCAAKRTIVGTSQGGLVQGGR